MKLNKCLDFFRAVTFNLPFMDDLNFDTIKSRFNTCDSCEFRTNSVCSICGCYVALKVAFPLEKCPKGFWTASKTKIEFDSCC